MTARKARPANGPADQGDGPAGDGGPGGDGAADAIPTSYERARDELAAVVAALEEGGLTLDESLALWERGQRLAAAWGTFLAGAQARVEAVLARSDDEEEPDEGSEAPERG